MRFEDGYEAPAGQRHDPAAALLARWQTDRDPDALDELLRAEIAILKQRIRHRAREMLSASATASDVAQEAAMRFIKSRDRPHFHDAKMLRAYLWTTAWRLLVGRLRRARRVPLRLKRDSSEASAALGSSGTTRELHARERTTAIELALNLMRPGDQEILRAVYIDGGDIEGAARRFGIAYQTAKTRLARARRALGQRMRNWVDLID